MTAIIDQKKENHFRSNIFWANKHARHTNEFKEKSDFEIFRNKIGDLVLLPQGTNQSYGAKKYSEKLQHYIKENLLVKSLVPLGYGK